MDGLIIFCLMVFGTLGFLCHLYNKWADEGDWKAEALIVTGLGVFLLWIAVRIAG